MPINLEFTVQGKASPSGSKKAFVNKKTGRVCVVDTAKNKDSWQSFVRLVATRAAAAERITPTRNAFRLSLQFAFARPKSHFGTGKNASVLKRSAPTFHTQKPDTTKLIRCTEDALQGVCWHDDCQVVSQQATKVWADVDSVKIVVEECMTWGEP